MKKTILIALMLLTSVMTFAQIPTNGLVAEYTFSGNAEDGTINDNDGLVNGATLTTDRFGNDSSAYYFDGVDDNVIIFNHPVLNIDINESYTISLWIKHNDVNSDKYFVSKYSGGGNSDAYAFGTQNVIDNGGPYAFMSSGGYYNEIRGNTISLLNNKWYHYVFVYESGVRTTLIVNNYLISDKSITYNGSIKNNLSLFIGSGANYTQYYNGKVDDIRIYDRALDQNEITQLYNEGNVTTGVSNNTITNNNTIVNYQVYDLSGKLIYNNSIKPLNVEFSKGIYILKTFKSDNSVVTNKFIVQ